MDDELKRYLDQKFKELHEYADEQFKEQREYTDERSRAIETTLLKEFHKWAPRLEGRLTVQRALTDNSEARLSVLEQRVDALEQEG